VASTSTRLVAKSCGGEHVKGSSIPGDTMSLLVYDATTIDLSTMTIECDMS